MNGDVMDRVFSPTTAHGALLLTLGARLERIKREERGASAIEFVIITAVLVALAAAVGLVIYNLVEGEAESIEIPDPPAAD